MAQITLRQLRFALAVAETGHFGRAAARCSVTQPALSQQLQALEAACGASLFDRLSSGTVPTPFGRDFLARAGGIVRQADDLSAFIDDRRSGTSTAPVRFGLIPTVAPYLLPEIFPALRAELPDINYAVSENHTEGLLADLADGELDIALVATVPRPGGPRLTVRPLFSDPFVLATAAEDPQRGPVPLHRIDSGRMLLLDEGHCFRDQAIAACALSDGAAARAFAATSLSTIVEFVANGLGITLLPSIAVRKETADRRVRVLELAPPGAARTLALVWRESAPLAPVFLRVADIIARRAPAPAVPRAAAEPAAGAPNPP
jgi:LysR family transcriptional regulator, hydrogen peroxide-inducible genes activator